MGRSEIAMKTKEYPTGTKYMFCPTCHNRVEFNMNINIGSGKINVICGCKKGVVCMVGKKKDKK